MFANLFPPSRNAAVVGGVVLLHVAALWALQSGLARQVAEVFVPVEMLAALITPPVPVMEPFPKAPVPVERPVARRVPTPLPARPPAIADTAPAPAALTGQQNPEPPAAMPPVATAQAPAAAPAFSTRIELPSTDADYLQNPRPLYPPVSKRLGEQGKVVVHVLIGADGAAQKADVRQSSGFERLDAAALATVLKWRYVPGKRAGSPEAMWFNVPITFVLE